MDEIITKLSIIEVEELENARKAHGKDFASPAEAYGVTAEEVYETTEAMNDLFEKWQNMIKLLHLNNLEDQKELYKRIETRALLLAAECIQVSAMCQKAIQSPCMTGIWEEKQ